MSWILRVPPRESDNKFVIEHNPKAKTVGLKHAYDNMSMIAKKEMDEASSREDYVVAGN